MIVLSSALFQETVQIVAEKWISVGIFRDWKTSKLSNGLPVLEEDSELVRNEKTKESTERPVFQDRHYCVCKANRKDLDPEIGSAGFGPVLDY